MGRVKKELIPSLIQFYYAHYSRNFNTWLHCWMTLVEFFTSCLREGSSVLWTEIWFFFIFASSSVLILCLHLLFQPAIFLALFPFLASFCTSLCFFVLELILHSYSVSCLLGLLWSAFWLLPSRYVIFWDNSGWKTTVRLSSPISCLEQGNCKQVAEDHIQLGFEYLQGCRLQNFFRPLLPCFTTSWRIFSSFIIWIFIAAASLFLSYCFPFKNRLTVFSLYLPFGELENIVRSGADLCSSHQYPPLDFDIQYAKAFLLWRAHKSCRGGEDCFPGPAGCALTNAAQNGRAWVCFKGMLLAQIVPAVCQDY